MQNKIGLNHNYKIVFSLSERQNNGGHLRRHLGLPRLQHTLATQPITVKHYRSDIYEPFCIKHDLLYLYITTSPQKFIDCNPILTPVVFGGKLFRCAIKGTRAQNFEFESAYLKIDLDISLSKEM